VFTLTKRNLKRVTRELYENYKRIKNDVKEGKYTANKILKGAYINLH
jgi:hypothetical protein